MGTDPGSEMIRAIRSEDVYLTENAIAAFKQYIKRNLVDLNQVSQYAHTLISVFIVHRLSILSFSTLCHLIKRVSIQDPYYLRNIYDPIMPFLLMRLNDEKESIRVTALKSIKTCIESSPSGEIDPVIHYLVSDGLQNYDNGEQSILSVLDLLYQIIESSGNFSFSFKYILDHIIIILSSSNQILIEKVSQILISYFTRINPTNNLAKNDLLNSLVSNKIPSDIIYNLLSSIDKKLLEKYQNQNQIQSQDVEVKRDLIRHQLDELLNNIPNWNVDDSSISPINIAASSYESLFNEFTINFDGKETEKNWKNRQLLIIKLRQIIRGNFLINLSYFVDLLKSIKEPICKGMLSLRTTLSNHSCQLSKELGIFVGKEIDFSFFEYLLNTLLKLTSARKIIQHQSSNVAIISILLNSNLNSRIFNLLLSTIQDKNIQPRIYTGNWIQLLLLKYYNDDINNFNFIVENVENIIVRGLSDPIPTVKDAMRNAFWTLCEIDPFYESKIMKKLDMSTVKALERSKKIMIQTTQHPLASKRPPIKELMKEKERERKRSMEPEIPSLVYEPIRKNHRSESVGVKGSSNIEKKKPTVRHHTIATTTEIQQQTNKCNASTDEFDDFTGRLKRENIIYEEITSDSLELQESGFKKILKENDSSLTVKFHNALNNLSIVNPKLFYILFESGNELYFKKISNYISTENTVRLFCLYLIQSSDFNRIEFIINELSLEDLCLSIINILSFSIDTSKIDNINLTMQFIKNRFQIISSILKILIELISIKKDIIKSYLLTSIFECLTSSFSLVQDDEIIKMEYLKVFKFCLDQYNELFLRSLEETKDPQAEHELFEALEIVKNNKEEEGEREEEEESTSNDSVFAKLLSPIKIKDEEIDENVDQMTRIIPRIKSENNDALFNEKKEFVSDMTMIFPKPKGNGIFDFDNIELRYDDENINDDIDLMSVSENNEVEDETYTKTEEKEGAMHDSNDNDNDDDVIIDEGTDISMLDKNEDVNKDDKSSEESTPSLHMLSIDKSDEKTEEEKQEKHNTVVESAQEFDGTIIEESSDVAHNVQGYLDIIMNELPVGSNANDISNLGKLEEFQYLLGHPFEFNREDIYSSMINNFQSGKFIIESILVLKSFKICNIEIIKLFDDNGIIQEDEDNEIFFGFQEYVLDFSIKEVLSLSIVKFGNRIQEILLSCILNKLKAREIDGEDIFMIERIIKINLNNEGDNYLRMLSYEICKELVEIHKLNLIDSNGIELVDKIIIDNMNEKVRQYCNL